MLACDQRQYCGGFHAGDPSHFVRFATTPSEMMSGSERLVSDLVGFGRRHIDMDPAELTDAVLYQLGP